MTVFQFLTAMIVTGLVLIIVKLFWKQIVIVASILYILGHLIFWSFLVAVLWAAFVSQTSQGWPLLWVYFFLLFSGVAIVYALIVIDAFDLVVDWFRLLIKKLGN